MACIAACIQVMLYQGINISSSTVVRACAARLPDILLRRPGILISDVFLQQVEPQSSTNPTVTIMGLGAEVVDETKKSALPPGRTMHLMVVSDLDHTMVRLFWLQQGFLPP